MARNLLRQEQFKDFLEVHVEEYYEIYQAERAIELTPGMPPTALSALRDRIAAARKKIAEHVLHDEETVGVDFDPEHPGA